jgi:vacuolar-type H+-ATPase subunit I/STV1
MTNKNKEVIGNLEMLNQEGTKELSEKIRIEHLTKKLLKGEPYDKLRLKDDIKKDLTQHIIKGIDAGCKIYAIKINENHGDFLRVIEDIGINPRTAQKYMATYVKFANTSALTYLESTKLMSALSIPDEEIAKMETEGHLIGIPLNDLKILSTREFDAEIKKWKKRTENVEKQNTEKDEKIAHLEKQLADIFNPYADDLEKEVEKKCHEMFLQAKAKLLYVRNIADQIYEHPELFTEASRMQVVGFTDLILHVAAEFREDIYKHALSEVGEGIPCVERLRCTPIQGNWNKDLVPEAYDIEPAPDKPFTNKEN